VTTTSTPVSDEEGMGASSLRADRATDASHGAPAGLRPDGSVSTSAGHTPLPWWQIRGQICSGTDYLDRTIVAFAGEAPGTPTEANHAFIVRACNSHYELLEALDGLVDGVLNDVDKAGRLRAAERAIAKARGQS